MERPRYFASDCDLPSDKQLQGKSPEGVRGGKSICAVSSQETTTCFNSLHSSAAFALFVVALLVAILVEIPIAGQIVTWTASTPAG